MSWRINIFCVCLLLLFIPFFGFTQNNSSPYSILGIGDLENSNYNRTSGMAGTGIAYRNDQYLINNNPASFSALKNQLFVAEVSGRGQFLTYFGNDITPGNNTTRDFAIRRLSLGMRIKNWWGSSAGLTPFSTSNYSFNGQKNISGTNNYVPADYEGTGGVNQVYWANAFQLTKHLSVGINTSMLWGSLSQTETFSASAVSTALSTSRNIYLRNLYFNYGLQYYAPVNKKWDLNLGLTYAAPRDLKAQYTTTVTDANGAQIKSEITNNNYFRVPTTFGAGIMLTKNKTLSFGADYRFQNWSSLHYQGTDYQLINSNRVSIGMEHSKKMFYGNRSIETIYWQAGAYYGNSYLNVYGQPLMDKGISLGIGANAKRSGLGYHIGFEYGVKGTETQGLIRENYANFTFTLSYKEIWLTKGRKYD